MPVDLIVAEKGSQAKVIAHVLGGKNVKLLKKRPVPVYYFKDGNREVYVTSVRGHVYELDFVDKYRKASWTKVDPKIYLIKAPVKKFAREGSQSIIKTIRSLAKRANRLIIATDYDREGENIGQQIAYIALQTNPRIEVKRARFSSMTPEEIRKAFENLVELDMNMVNASEVRQEVDLRMGVALTRLFSGNIQKRLGAYGVVISLGPVQTPTLGFVVRRYLEHLKSKREAKPKYTIAAVTRYGEFVLRGKQRDNKKAAEEYAKTLPKILSLKEVKKKESTKAPPLPLNTPRLAELAARYLGFSAKKTLNVAERLYLSGYISYPRTETDKRNDEALKEAFRLANQAAKLFGVSRKPKKPVSGKRDDKAHPPIHPVRIVNPKRLSGDDAKLYDLIIRHFLANFGPRAKIKNITYTLTTGKDEFVKDTTEIIEKGRLEVYPFVSVKDEKLEVPNEVKVERYKVITIPPKITPPITEAELVKLMDKHGIGTDATFAEHIAKLIERRYVERKGKYLIPTELGLKLYESIMKTEPELVKPDVRSFMESTFKAVEEGRLEREEAVRININKFSKVYDKLASEIHNITDDLKELAKMQMKDVKRKKKRRKKRK